MDSKGGSGYGYMWWISGDNSPFKQYETYASTSVGGHMILVMPKLNTVLVLRVDTYQRHALRRKDRNQLLQMLVATRTSEPHQQPALQPLPARRVVTITLVPEVLHTYVKDDPFESGAVVRITWEQGELLARTREGIFGLTPLSRKAFSLSHFEGKRPHKNPRTPSKRRGYPRLGCSGHRRCLACSS